MPKPDSNHKGNNRCQVSGVGCKEGESLNPET